ncbi:mucin-2 [Trichomycterus rosablanca]|uniref:mucin-2 n=1 Tax=Trichomycterus rosablanca TaxID=2290929 RepID=UPI002F35EFA1
MIKKGGLNFLNRRNQSLFDNNTQFKDLENVEFVYDSAVIPDSGTAKVRSRPTVKHFSTFGDGATGYPVPIPKVPLLPPVNGAQITGSTDRLSLISIDDVEEGQILIPPPPSTAPPPPPPQFIPPPPGHTVSPPAVFGEPNPPSMRPPKPPSMAAPENHDLSAIRPPPMTPPKPPGAQMMMPQDIPDCPKFTPPLPPSKSPIIRKMPPEKPTRYSSIPNLVIIPSGPTNPTASHTVRSASTFNLQNTALIQTVPKTSILPELPDSGQPPVPPVKPTRRNSSGMKLEINQQDLRSQRTFPTPTPNMIVNGVPEGAGTPLRERVPGELSAQHLLQPSTTQSYSPLLSHKLRNLKTNEGSSVKEPAASPFALLMAAKERDKQRSGLSRQNSTKSTSSIDSSGASFQPSETRSNSFMVTPRPNVTSTNLSPTHLTESKPETQRVTYSRPQQSVPSISPSTSIMGKNSAINTSSITSPTSSKSLTPLPAHYDVTDGVGGLSFIPPPLEFANSDPEDETPPSTYPPYPPTNSMRVNSPLNSITNSPASLQNTKPYSSAAPTSAAPSVLYKPNPPSQSSTSSSASVKTLPQTLPPSPPKIQPPSPPKIQPSSPPKIQPPSPPKLPPQALTPTLTKSPPQASIPSQAPPPTAANQATLLSILQKKMLEMDSKFSHTPEVSSEWDDEDVGVSHQHNSAPKPKNLVQSVQSKGLDMTELQNKVTQKAQSKPASSSGSASSKQQFGMTFMVRPGTKQPITPVAKTE